MTDTKNTNDAVSIKDYVDTRFEDLKEMLKEIQLLNAKATDQYSKTTDEWKTLHNDLQRKIQDDRNMYVRKEDLKKSLQIIWGIVIGLAMFIVTLAIFYKK